MSAPRVLLSGVVLGQPMGGVRRHNAELLPRAAARLAREGGGLSVLEGTVPVAFELPAPIERIASRVPAGPPAMRALREGAALRAVIAAARSAGKPFDLVHSAHLPAPTRLGLPLCLTLHDLRALALADGPRSGRWFAAGVLRRALRGAARVVTVSAAVRTDIVARFLLDPARVVVVPNAADHLAPLPRDPADDAPILHVGHLEPRKNVSLLVRALALDPALPALRLAGAAKGEEERRLRALADELGVAARVRFDGPFEEAELPELYARAACVVLPSLVEGFGLAALEARRAGVPLAVSRIPALVEVAGLEAPSFDPRDPADCARALRAALATPAEALDRGRAHAAGYSWERSADALVDAWQAAAR